MKKSNKDWTRDAQVLWSCGGREACELAILLLLADGKPTSLERLQEALNHPTLARSGLFKNIAGEQLIQNVGTKKVPLYAITDRGLVRARIFIQTLDHVRG